MVGYKQAIARRWAVRRYHLPFRLGSATSAAFACAILFTPVASSAEDAGEIAIEQASGRALIDLLIGNTLVVRRSGQADGTHGHLHLMQDGTADFREILRDASSGHISWSVDEYERLCVTENLYPDQRKDCGLFRVMGDDLYIYADSGKVEHLKARLLRGKPRE